MRGVAAMIVLESVIGFSVALEPMIFNHDEWQGLAACTMIFKARITPWLRHCVIRGSKTQEPGLFMDAVIFVPFEQ